MNNDPKGYFTLSASICSQAILTSNLLDSELKYICSLMQIFKLIPEHKVLVVLTDCTSAGTCKTSLEGVVKDDTTDRYGACSFHVLIRRVK